MHREGRGLGGRRGRKNLRGGEKRLTSQKKKSLLGGFTVWGEWGGKVTSWVSAEEEGKRPKG